MPSLLAPIRARLRLLAARRSTRLDPGEHASVLRHRSMEFEELREYAVGDDVADIDWKATARTGAPLLRQYTAMRAQGLVFAVDGGADAAGHAARGELVRDVALELVATLGLAAVAAGDRVSLVHDDGGATAQLRDGSTPGHLDRVLARVGAPSADPTARVDLSRLLLGVARRVRRRSVVVVVTGDVVASPSIDRAVAGLRARHDVVWLTVGDVDPTDPALAARTVVDAQLGVEVPAYLRVRARAGGLGDDLAAQRSDLAALLRRRGVRHARVAAVDEVVPALVRLADGMRRRRGGHHRR